MPAGLGYRFLDGHDPLPALHSLMDRLEARFTWRVQSGRPLPERILRYADGILGLKEVEYLGSPQPGTFKERSCNLIEQILQRIEVAASGETVGDGAATGQGPASRLPGHPRESDVSRNSEALEARRDLDDLFLVIQVFSYPGITCEPIPPSSGCPRRS